MPPTYKAADPNRVSSDVRGLLEQACVALNGGKPVAARGILSRVLALVPGNTEAIRLTGIAARLERDYPAAIQCFRQVLSTRPDDASLHVLLGIALYEYGESEQAIRHLQRASVLAPDSASAWFNLGEALKHQARIDDAVAALQQALRADPAHAAARLALARVWAGLGQVDLAVSEFRGVLRRNPANAYAWFGLANLNTVRFGVDDVAQLRRAHARADLSREAHNLLGFTLAKSLEDQGDHAAAFEVFRSANAAQRRDVQWDAAAERSKVDTILRAFEDWSPPAPTDAQRGREVILIVSIPRSGSTLVEQILASHPEVEGANEIRDLAEVVDAETLRRPTDFPDWIAQATPADWQRLGDAYLARTARWREHKPRFTDKSLVTWYLVGTALAMLPAARVVVVRRDPVETCLACYRQWFRDNAGFAYDLDELADYYIDFRRLTRFWMEKFPARVLDLEYETLVTRPEATIRGLLDFCQLDFDRACLAFHATDRMVMSAPSAAQVRQPLRRDTARAARYGDKLDRLRARLGQAGLVTDSGQVAIVPGPADSDRANEAP